MFNKNKYSRLLPQKEINKEHLLLLYCSRFIINLPPEDRDNLVRICFQIELAHWFYLDYYCTDESNNLNPCSIREFAAHIFQVSFFCRYYRSFIA